MRYFYPRSPCGERPKDTVTEKGRAGISIHALLAESDSSRPTLGKAAQPISIHALLAESDCLGRHQERLTAIFLSTLSLRRATRRVLKCDNRAIISIHALLAESDAFRSPRIALMVDFYPRSPCGERQPDVLQTNYYGQFLSTLSLRRATFPAPTRVL